MKNWMEISLTSALAVVVTLLASAASAATITALDIRTAAGGIGGDFGVTSLTVDDVVISSTLPSGSPANLAGFNNSTGVFGNVGNTAVGGLDEAMEFDFNALGSVSIISFVAKSIGADDLSFFLEGFSSDPGVSLDLPGFTPTYHAGTQTLEIAVNVGTGFTSALTLMFANPVAVSTLTLTNPVFNLTAGGTGFNSIDFTFVPEPTTAVMIIMMGSGVVFIGRKR